MNNKVELLGWYGGDTINACSAWTSTSRTLTQEKKNRIPKLLNDLAFTSHHTPFEKSIVHFLIDTDIATHIQVCKHRLSSLNAESSRYKELKEDKYYLPADWKGIKDSFNIEWLDILSKYTEQGNKFYHECLKDLEKTLGRKRAKESARYFKTYNSQIQGDLMFNWRSFMNFQKLRNEEHAQLEIREIAAKMLDLVRAIEQNPFEHSLKAFGY